MEKKNGLFIGAIVIFVIMLIGMSFITIDNSTINDCDPSTGESCLVDGEVALANCEIEGECLMGKYNVEMSIKDYGVIKLELDADVAPITVTNFISLVESNFYDGLTFHRIIDGFMIQGGDPDGNGTGGSSETIKGEFSSNGVENNIKHVRGTISMARSTLANSASSQFFIMHEDSSHLDGEYAGFGIVTSGMEVVDAIASNAIVTDGNGTVSNENQPVIEYIKVID